MRTTHARRKAARQFDDIYTTVESSDSDVETNRVKLLPNRKRLKQAVAVQGDEDEDYQVEEELEDDSIDEAEEALVDDAVNSNDEVAEVVRRAPRGSKSRKGASKSSYVPVISGSDHVNAQRIKKAKEILQSQQKLLTESTVGSGRTEVDQPSKIKRAKRFQHRHSTGIATDRFEAKISSEHQLGLGSKELQASTSRHKNIDSGIPSSTLSYGASPRTTIPRHSVSLAPCSIPPGGDPPNETQKQQIMQRFYDQVLSWSLSPNFNIRHPLLNDSTERASTPSPNTDYTQFESLASYIQFFEPLLFEDLHCQMVGNFQERRYKSKYRLQGVIITQFIPINPDGRLHHVDLRLNRRLGQDAAFGPGEFVHISPEPSRFTNRDIRQNLTHDTHAIGYITQVNRVAGEDGVGCTFIRLQLRLPPHSSASSFTNEDTERCGRMFDLIQKAARAQSSNDRSHRYFSLVALENCTSVVREFVALHSVGSLKLLTHLLGVNRTSSPELTSKDKSGRELMVDNKTLSGDKGSIWEGLSARLKEHMTATLNPSQLVAVQEACGGHLTHTGFTLLQGPPGTGKTKTVVALLNILHLSRYQSYYDYLLTRATQKLAVSSKTIRPLSEGKDAAQMSLQDILGVQEEQYSHKMITITKPRILVCAPSNAGVDEVVARLMDVGLLDGNLQTYKPDLLRIGRSESIRQNVFSGISLEVRVEEYFSIPPDKLGQRIHNGRAALAQTRARLREIQEHVYRCGEGFVPPVHIAVDVVNLCERQHLILLDIERTNTVLGFWDTVQGNGNSKHRNRSTWVEKLERSFLNEAHIVFCTLSGAGSSRMSNLRRGFDHMVIDEAAQSVELSILVALRHNVRHCVLVGDPRQLPATVFIQSQNARFYERSLFERLEKSAHPMHTLTTQYRMHPQIREFPSIHFYKSALCDGPNVLGDPYKTAYHQHAEGLFRPFMLFDLPSTEIRGAGGGGEESRSTSLSNREEADFVVSLIEVLLDKYPHVSHSDIGVITFYSSQKSVLQNALDHLFKRRVSPVSANQISISTQQSRKQNPPQQSSPPQKSPSPQTAPEPTQERKRIPPEVQQRLEESKTSSQVLPAQSPSLRHGPIEVATVDGFQVDLVFRVKRMQSYRTCLSDVNNLRL